MPRPIPQHGEPVNGDSFLDIVASVVSIMIIMVVMVGMRIKNSPVTVSVPSNPAMKELENDVAKEKSLRADVFNLAGETQQLQQEVARRGLQRDVLATMVTAVEQTIQERRQKLDAAKQANFDLARGLSEAKFQLDQIHRQRDQVADMPAAPVVVESYPTPISRAVDGPEAHLLISNGRVVFVPLEALLQEFKSQARRQAHKLIDQSELTDTVGPIEGFQLRYTLERHDVSPDEMRTTGHGGSYVGLRRWSLVPTSNDLGEPVRLALDLGSDFRQKLKSILPGRTTITIWVYPDGFDAFREIRKELYRQNYTIAARPLPAGEPIAGSPNGSKSAAQ
jgi:hypothetical protein